MPLVLTVNIGEKIMIGETEVKFVDKRSTWVRVTIDAPKEVEIKRFKDGKVICREAKK